MLSPPGNPASWWTVDFWSKSISLILADKKQVFFGPFQWFLGFWIFIGCWSLPTSLLCILGELVGGGSVALAISLVSGDRCHATRAKWHMTFFSFSSLRFFGIGSNICTHQKIYYLPFAWFWQLLLKCPRFVKTINGFVLNMTGMSQILYLYLSET